ncbi:putative transporter [Cercophora samala]|uniref:Transporter n=1 Tax=Cercophora samala TaxID=330535 RepID=A0AA39ZHR9_9PEZI|nr:putative transporter [Cercophora samala]
MVRFELTVQIGRSRQSSPYRESYSQPRSRSISRTRHHRCSSEDRIPLVERAAPPARDDDPASISLPPSPTHNNAEKQSLPSGPRSSYQPLSTFDNEPVPNRPSPAKKSPSPSPKQDGPGSYTDFPPLRRNFILSVITIAGFFGPLAGGIYLPALPVLEKEFNASATAINVTVSVFMMTFAFGPLFWSTFADWKGRRPLYLISLAIYILANVLLAAVPSNYGALVFLRIVQAFGSASVVSMGAGTVADITEPKKRAFAMSIFLMGPQCGPVLGPVLGGALAEANWRWIFGFLAISGGILWLAILFFLPETLRARVGGGRIYTERPIFFWPPSISSPLAPSWERGPPPPVPTLKGYWNLFIYPPIGIVSFNTAMLYSTYFAIAVQLPTELSQRYNWGPSGIGAGFLAVGIAMIVGSLLGGRASDWRRARAAKQLPEGTKIDPEFRLVDQIWGVLICVLGTLLYGWLVNGSKHPAAVLFATFLTGFGMNWVFVTTTAFLTECVAQQAAGAFALGNLLRNPGAAIASAITPTLVAKMGSGWCFTGLALLDLLLVGTAVILLRLKCPGWRAERAAKIQAGKKVSGSVAIAREGPPPSGGVSRG